MSYIYKNRLPLLAGVVGIVVGAGIVYTLFIDTKPTVEPYHIHADFVIYLHDERLDLAKAEYMTDAKQSLHDAVHLHDDEGAVVHVHATGITFSEFLSSLGYTLTNDCFIAPDRAPFCTNDTDVLQLYVNDTLYTDDISAYMPQDLDQILLYFGTATNPKLQTYRRAVNDRACIFSGTCPEWGVAPAESCGLTCEL